MSIIPKDSLVLVTGANGFIAAHIVNTLLAEGYRVRGTARAASKIAALKAFWDETYGPERFETAVVEDMAKDGAFVEALKGVAGVVHVASIMLDADSIWLNPALVIDTVVNTNLFLLRASAAQPTVKSFVYTSSAGAAGLPKLDVEYDVGEDTWNTESIQKAYNLPADDPSRPLHAYCASKALSEQAAWKFYKEEKPSFVFNTVLPSMNIGPPVGPADPRSSSALISTFFDGDFSMMHWVTPQHYIDVRDTAELHMHALTSTRLPADGVRILASGSSLNANDLLQILRDLYPERSFPPDIEGMGRDLTRVDQKRAVELLGRFRGLKDAVKANAENL
ncbi:NAD-P-binding protein [Athelia psychrophila]|uniref:NAD-P-binding protein n=1 Tax=Athelia psychrophila TaxID=1759441 RepID=A0A166HVU2_9AGAM|nr:NAD-P-binding protein [Fibularhizoctonia sp. CBS 109695]